MFVDGELPEKNRGNGTRSLVWILLLVCVLLTGTSVMTINTSDRLAVENKLLKQDVVELENRSLLNIILIPEDSMVCSQVAAPAELQHIFNEMGGRYNIEPNLLAAIAKQESRFDLEALSPAGAMGLMGLMPITIRHLKERHDLDIDPWDAKSAVEGAAAYLQELQSRFNTVEALAAYNMGPTRLRALNGDFSRIQETKEYVEKISSTIGRSMPSQGLSQ